MSVMVESTTSYFLTCLNDIEILLLSISILKLKPIQSRILNDAPPGGLPVHAQLLPMPAFTWTEPADNSSDVAQGGNAQISGTAIEEHVPAEMALQLPASLIPNPRP